MSVRSAVIDTFLEQTRQRRFLDIGHNALGVPGWTVLGTSERAEIQHDPLDLPWPLPDVSIYYIRCLGLISHIPQACPDHPVDPLLEFLDECWRVLKPGGRLYLSGPHGLSPLAWADPTNCRPVTKDAVLCASAEVRAERGLASLQVACDFQTSYGYTLNEQAQIQEIHFVLTKPERSN